MFGYKREGEPDRATCTLIKQEQLTSDVLLPDAHKEAGDDHQAAHNRSAAGAVAEYNIRADDIEHSRETAADVVEGNADVLQAQIIEENHTDEDERKR